MKKLLYIILLSCQALVLFGQTDTEFWFAVPYATDRHDGPVGAKLRLTSAGNASTVTVTQPYNPQFAPIIVNLLPNETKTVDFNDVEYDKISGYAFDVKTNYAIHIESTDEITAYFELLEFDGGAFQNFNNPDIFALKGTNALGYEFYTPFQTNWHNRNYAFNTSPDYSAIDIVATEDSTEIEIFLRKPAAKLGGPPTDVYPAGVPFTIILNKGQTYSLVPKMLEIGTSGNYRPSHEPQDRLVGTYIKSNKPIAVTIKDDSVREGESSGPYDFVGDQIIPVKNIKNKNVIGHEYLVMKGKVSGNNERFYILATQDGTNIEVDGVPVGVPINKGIQLSYNINNGVNYRHVIADKPVYVFHVSGNGGEYGGAILPTIDGCSGSLSVSFMRSKGGSDKLFLNIMTKDYAIDSFKVEIDGVLTPGLINGSMFEQAGTSGWYVLKDIEKEFTTAEIPANQVIRVYNTAAVFHLGMLNGRPSGGGNMYGYFSDYDQLEAEAFSIETGTPLVQLCGVDTVQLNAKGGLSYFWSPTEYVDDPTAQNPNVFPPKGSITTFTVRVLHPCDGYQDRYVSVLLPEEPYAFLAQSENRGCAPLEIDFTNGSSGAIEYVHDYGDGSPHFKTNNYNDINESIVYNNTSDTLTHYVSRLSVANIYGCTSVHYDTIWVYPQVNSSFEVEAGYDTIGCHPLEVGFYSTSTGNTDKYKWSYGDGVSATDSSVVHTFSNTGFNDSTYTVKLIAISPFLCHDTASRKITVHPNIHASFASDPAVSCSPLSLNLDPKNSIGVDTFKWHIYDSPSTFDSLYITDSYNPISILHNDATQVSPDTIIVGLVVANEEGCYDTVQDRKIIVYPEVHAQFVPSQTIVCDSVPINFANNSVGFNLSYFWDFDDGTSSTAHSLDHTYYNRSDADSVFNTTLIARSEYLCSDTLRMPITIHPYVNSQFTVEHQNNCSPLQTNIYNTSIAPTGSIFDWNFGDGDSYSTGIKSDATHTFTNPLLDNDTVYTINLTITSAQGCVSELERELKVFPKVEPQFIFDLNQGCQPLEVTITNQSNGGSLSYDWDFGDNSTSSTTQLTFTKLFENHSSNDTTYHVNLTATNPFGCSQSIQKDVEVYAFIKANYNLANQDSCSPFPVGIDNRSQGGIANYFWNFGDGSPISNLFEPSHSYTNTTNGIINRNLELIVKNSHACYDTLIRQVTVYPEVTADFVTSDAVYENCQPFLVDFINNSNIPATQFDWDFGDGYDSGEKTPGTHTFSNLTNNDATYPVTLIATSDYGCRDEITKDIIAYAFIESNFVLTNAESCSPFPLDITNTSKGGIAEYEWEFNDGSAQSDLSKPTHTYSNTTDNPIYRDLRLVVKNNHACYDTLIRQVSVYPEVVADFATNDGVYENCQPFDVGFVNNSNIPATLFNWEFGDGFNSGSKTPGMHTFANLTNNDVTYPVTLTVTSNYGCRDEITKDIIAYAYIEAKYDLGKSDTCSPFPLDINNTSKGGISEYFWEFDDGSGTSNLFEPNHTYSNVTDNVIDRDLRLVVKNNHACYDTIIKTVNVYPEVIADFTTNDGLFENCQPFDVQFVNQSNVPATNFVWDFGDAGGSVLQTPGLHSFTNTGTVDSTYTVTLLATSDYGCRDIVSKDIISYAYIESKFSLANTDSCSPFPLGIDNLSPGGVDEFFWNFGDGSPISNQRIPEHTYSNKTNVILYPTLELIVKNQHACYDTMQRQVTVYPEVVANFMTSNGLYEACQPFDVNFVNTSNAPAEFFIWDFDEGTFNIQDNPSKSFENFDGSDKVYHVNLYAESDYGCIDDTTIDIIAYAYTEAAFSADDDDVCYGYPITIKNESSPGSVQFDWNLGNGVIRNDVNGFTYTWLDNTEGRTYNLSLTARNAHGCSHTKIHPIQIFPQVRARIALSDSTNCHPLKTKFFNLSQNVDANDKFYWNFGHNTGSSTSFEPNDREFVNETKIDKVYNLVLRAEERDNGCFGYDTLPVTVHAVPDASFKLVGGLTKGCPYFPVDIQNTTRQVLDYENSYQYIFGDNSFPVITTSRNNIRHEYDNITEVNQLYNLSLITTSAMGCKDTANTTITVHPRVTANFEAMGPTEACSPHILEFEERSVNEDVYQWSFGDGAVSTDAYPSNRYVNSSDSLRTHKVTLKAISDYECWDTVSTVVTIYPQPTALFYATPRTQFFPNSEIEIDNRTNHIDIWNYDWNFGDNTAHQTSFDPEPHDYGYWGDYNVTMKVWNDYCSDSLVRTVSIYPAMPIARFDSSVRGCVPLTVTFNDNSRYGKVHTWDFDDGFTYLSGPSSDEQAQLEDWGEQVNHTFTEPGLYNVILKIEGDGGVDETNRIIEVYPKPDVSFDIAPKTVMLPDEKIQTFNSTVSSPDYQWLWDFGDGSKSTSIEPDHLYTELGKYDISLVVWTENMCVDSMVLEQIVSVEGTGIMELPNAFIPSLSGPNGGVYSQNDPITNVFHPFHDGVVEYRLEIYTRWGEMIFVSEDINIGWDGYIEGALAKQDVYIWRVKGTYTNGNPFVKAGDVTLIVSPNQNE